MRTRWESLRHYRPDASSIVIGVLILVLVTSALWLGLSVAKILKTNQELAGQNRALAKQMLTESAHRDARTKQAVTEVIENIRSELAAQLRAHDHRVVRAFARTQFIVREEGGTIIVRPALRPAPQPAPQPAPSPSPPEPGRRHGKGGKP